MILRISSSDENPLTLKPKTFLQIFAALALLTVSFSAKGFDPFTIEDIRVEGLRRITVGAVFVLLPVQVGDEIDDELSARSIQALFNSGFFDDIRLEQDGSTLVITVVENPLIAEITIEGNKRIKTEQIEAALEASGIAARRVYNPIKVEEFIEGLRQEYKATGRFATQVDATIVALDRNRVEVFIQIAESKVALIEEIRILGNMSVSEKDIRDEMKLTTKKTLGLFNRNNRYSRTQLTADLETITTLYQNQGFIQFQIVSSQAFLSDNMQRVSIVITLDEGPQFSFGEVTVVADQDVVDIGEIEQMVAKESKTTFSRGQVNESRQNVIERFADEGYSLASVEAYPDIKEDERLVDVEYVVEPGRLTYIRQIVFIGNIVTSDEVLRREMRIFEGGEYSAARISESRERLGRLGFFESVDLSTQSVPGVPDQVDIIVEVKERLTGSFSIGVGYRSDNTVVLNLHLSQSNLYGTGKRLSTDITRSDYETRIGIDFVNPYHTLDGVARGFHIDVSEEDLTDSEITEYKSDYLAFGMRYRFPISPTVGVGTDFEYEYRELSTGRSAVIDYRDRAFIDKNRRTSVGRGTISIRGDDRNRSIFPSSGGERTASFELVGGDASYYVTRTSASEYFSLGEKTTMKVFGGLDYGDGLGSTKRLPFYNRFYAGGSSTVRGFDAQSLGPRELCEKMMEGKTVIERCPNADPIGGSVRLIGRSEVYLPIFGTADTADRRFLAFADLGNVFDEFDDVKFSELRGSAGLGFTWLSPIGPLQISRSFAHRKKPGDKLDYLQVTLGSFLD